MTATLAPAHVTGRTYRGVGLMLGFCVMAPLLDVSAKLATATIPVGQITTARFVLQFALMLPVAVWMGLGWGLDRRTFGLMVVRALLLVASTFTFVAAVEVMPIADALAIVFVEPFILLILGYLLFRDSIGPRRIAASVVGFGGALLVIQPSLDAYGWVALYPLACAFAFAFYMLITRAASPLMHPVMMQVHTSWIGSIFCLVAVWAYDGSGSAILDPVMPQGWAWAWLMGVGFWATVSHMSITYALKYAPSATLAPLHYTELVSAVLYGYLVFGDFPNRITWIGIALITGSGLYIIWRERQMSRALPGH
ncbi:MAG: DMT family transporter [Pseudomonadota bacterium]